MFPWVSGSWDDRIDFLRMRVNFDRNGGWMTMMMVITPLCNNKKRRHVENESRMF